MKVQLSITLIICGTMLILVPHIYSVMQTSLVVQAMTELSEKVSLSTGLKKSYQCVCIYTGIVMILVGVIGSFLPISRLQK